MRLRAVFSGSVSRQASSVTRLSFAVFCEDHFTYSPLLWTVGLPVSAVARVHCMISSTATAPAACAAQMARSCSLTASSKRSWVSSLGTCARDLVEVRADLPAREAAGRLRRHNLINPGQTALPFRHDHRCERGIPITRHLNGHRPVEQLITVLGRVPLITLDSSRSSGARFLS